MLANSYLYYFCDRINNMDKEKTNITPNEFDAVDNKKRLYITYDKKLTTKIKLKEEGLIWDYSANKWFFPEAFLFKLKGIAPWINNPLFHIYCSELYILENEIECWNCKNKIKVYAFATDRSYQKDEDYKANKNLKLLPYLTWTPQVLYSYIKKNTNLKPRVTGDKSSPYGAKYLANICPHCHSTQGDWHLFYTKSKNAFWSSLVYDDVPKLKAAKFENDILLEFNYYVPQLDLNEPNTSIYQVDKDINIQNMAKLKENWEIQPNINVIREKIPIHKQKPYKKKKSPNIPN